MREKRKNVHAHVQGRLIMWNGDLYNGRTDIESLRIVFPRVVTNERHGKLLERYSEVSYNPYRADHFFDIETLDTVTEARYALLSEDGKAFYRSM